MGLIELIILSVGLAMDAFAVAICKGLGMKKVTLKKAGIVGAYFGVFQAVMPLIGYLVGFRFQDKIKAVDHWIAFILLVVIGINMVKESLSKDEEEIEEADLGFKSMIMLSIATSIDALAVGISFAFLNVNIVSSSTIIGIITFIVCFIGVIAGKKIGGLFKDYAELVGGIILILIGINIFNEHTGILTHLLQSIFK